MEPITILSLITSGIPFLTALIKKVFKTNRIQVPLKHGIHALIPIIIGILSSGLYSYSQNKDWLTSLIIGLGSGGAASSFRDIDKNLTRIAEAVIKLFENKNDEKPA